MSNAFRSKKGNNVWQKVFWCLHVCSMMVTLNLTVTWILLPPHPNLKGMQATNMMRKLRFKGTQPHENVVVAHSVREAVTKKFASHPINVIVSTAQSTAKSCAISVQKTRCEMSKRGCGLDCARLLLLWTL